MFDEKPKRSQFNVALPLKNSCIYRVTIIIVNSFTITITSQYVVNTAILFIFSIANNNK